jgi:transposase InsO family protein
VAVDLHPRDQLSERLHRGAAAGGGVPQQILTDNGGVFTGRFGHPPTAVLLDRICREIGVEHLLTTPRSPMTTGAIERFHRSVRAECLTGQLFPTHPGSLPTRVRRADSRSAAVSRSSPACRYLVPWHPHVPLMLASPPCAERGPV